MNAITVKLPCECSGQEILDAFRAAATFQETPTRRWEAHGYTTPSGFATTGKTFSQQRGYLATPAYLCKQSRMSRLFHGRRGPIWRTKSGQEDISRFRTQIKLHAIQPDKMYGEVELTLSHSLLSAWFGVEETQVVHNPDDKEFKWLRLSYDRIIQKFLRRLEH